MRTSRRADQIGRQHPGAFVDSGGKAAGYVRESYVGDAGVQHSINVANITVNAITQGFTPGRVKSVAIRVSDCATVLIARCEQWPRSAAAKVSGANQRGLLRRNGHTNSINVARLAAVPRVTTVFWNTVSLFRWEQLQKLGIGMERD